MNVTLRRRRSRFASLVLVALAFGCGRRAARPMEGPSPAGAAAPAPAPPGPPATSQAEAARAGFLAVVAAKRELAARCWAPAVARQPTPSRSSHVLRVTFDPDGAATRREVIDRPGESRPDVGSCLRGLPLDLKSRPSAFPSTVEVTLTFP